MGGVMQQEIWCAAMRRNILGWGCISSARSQLSSPLHAAPEQGAGILLPVMRRCMQATRLLQAEILLGTALFLRQRGSQKPLCMRADPGRPAKQCCMGCNFATCQTSLIYSVFLFPRTSQRPPEQDGLAAGQGRLMLARHRFLGVKDCNIATFMMQPCQGGWGPEMSLEAQIDWSGLVAGR